MYTEHFNEKEIAMTREKEIKMWKSRKRIEKLISHNNDPQAYNIPL